MLKLKKKDVDKEKEKEKENVDSPEEVIKMYTKKNDADNKDKLEVELKNRKELEKSKNEYEYLYPNLDDPNFNAKIANKKEFSDTKYDGAIYDVEKYAEILSVADYELLPQQAFVRNFLSFQTPYNSLMLFHGLGSGKTCSAIGVCEEMRDYLKQMGINKRIIIVASPNVQDNFKLQLFDERKLKEVDGIWSMKGCLGNKLLKEINPTGMKGLKREKVIQQVKNVINASYSFQGYLQFSNEIVRKSGKTNIIETKIKNLEMEYSNSLVVIDEVHNIRISEDNENKNVAKNLMFLVSVVSNVRLLLLSATPMFNSYKEIVWLLNLMNMNDRRGIISVSDIFDNNGNWKIDKDGTEIGKEMLIRKATGYVSYVRGENPYTFPFRVYPDKFAIKNTFKTIEEYPKYQINGRKISNDKKITKLSLFLNLVGEYQEMGYKYIIDRLRSRGESYQMTKKGTQRNVAAFSTLKSFGYTDLQIPIESLNIVYPYDGLDELVKRIQPIEYNETEETDIDDISPTTSLEKDIVEEIDDVISNGPQFVSSARVSKNSELESEPAVTEGIEADNVSIVNAVERDARDIKKIEKSKSANKKKSSNLIFDILDEEDIITEDANNSSKEDKISTQSSKSSSSKSLSSLSKSSSSEPSVNKFSPQEISFKGSLSKKIPLKSSDISGLHINETDTKSQFPSEKNSIKETTSSRGGTSNSSSNSSSKEQLYIDPKDLTGSQGLKRIMDYVDSKTPSIKGQFEYKRNVPHVFEEKEIGKYSSKIKNICNYIYNKDTGKVSEGIILVYSSYIDAGIIPMALALEEMGFTRYGEKAKPLFKTPPVPVVDVRTMKSSVSRKDFKPARYIMITGDPRISPNNDADVKAITNNDNIFREDKDGILEDISGEIIKVVLISQAGSEGLDFKAIRQVHILEPWYNVNRLEQIIGRAVRNFSHKDLPFSKRNVQIFLYGTILTNAEEEAADLYIYRTSELKAVKIGKVTRLLKQTAVDCIINHDQTELISNNFNKIEENRNITQVLSDNKVLNNFVIGDTDNTATCDFMECEFKCLPDINVETLQENADTYNESFMLINSDKIIQKIKILMKMQYFYKKNDLLKLINIPKKYPTTQIYAALTQLINDGSEYIVDKYGRTGYLVNVGEYYLFQPSELNYKNISIYDRSVPINYKHDMIKFEIKTNAIKPVIDKRGITEKDAEGEDVEGDDDENAFLEGKSVLDAMFNNYKLASNTIKIQRGNDNWYHLCGVIMRRISKEDNIILADSKEKRVEILEKLLIEHIVDSLMMNDKINLLNYIYGNKNVEIKLLDEHLKRFYSKIKIYLQTKFVVAKGITGIVIFDGPSRVNNLNIFVLDDDKWILAKPEDKRDLGDAILKKYRLKANLNHYVGFIGFENNNKYMVCQIKDTKNERSTGFRCDQAGKNKIISILRNIDSDDRFISKIIKKDKEDNDAEGTENNEGAKELYIRVELTLRIFEYQKLNNKTWFVDTETAIVNEFQKKEKGNK